MSVKKLFDLSGRVALITGGSRGLGLQIGEALGEMGAKLAITARKQDELDEAVAHLKKLNIEAVAIACDLSKPESIDPLVDRVVKECGTINILVNNAGASWGAATVDHPLDAWEKVIRLNLTSPFLLSQAVGKRIMIPAQRGRIVNIASIAGMIGPSGGMNGTIAYNSSKGGAITFTKALAAEWAQYNITVNAICPGFFPTKMTKGTLDKYGDALNERNPMKRTGGPEDLKGLAVLLASDASAFITGQAIAVDGGVTAI
ncbi:MAG TPA: SDR family oxidoreductase [Magnetospirillaceae bacterium]|jgi:gluconate 5-dehydrogenase